MSTFLTIITPFASITTAIIAAYLAYKASIKLQKKKSLEELCTAYLMATYNLIYEYRRCDYSDQYYYNRTRLCLVATNKIIEIIKEFDKNRIYNSNIDDTSGEYLENSPKQDIIELYIKLINDIRMALGYPDTDMGKMHFTRYL